MEDKLRKLLFPQQLAPGADPAQLEHTAFAATAALIGEEHARAFWQALPNIRQLLQEDLQAALDGDPAAEDAQTVILCYPGFYAVTVYRLAHTLQEMGIPLLPRLMTERVHSATGIDIHPGAKIGRGFFIDHGTGVVIGQTTVIGDRVKLYQGVTLGALSTADPSLLRHIKRHPTIEDDVTIYANATILGGETVIGKGCTIGANVFLTESVAPGSRVTIAAPRLQIRSAGRS